MTPLKIRDYFNDIGCVFRLSAPVAIAAQLAVLLGCFSVACTNYGVDTAQESGSTDISSSFGKDVKLADVCKDVCKSEVKVVGDGAKSDGVVADNGPIDKENAADASDDVAIAACATPCAVDSDCPTTACNSASCKTGCCVFNAVVDGAICDDGVGCNGPDLCTAGLCSGGEADCSDKLDCTIDFCDDKSGNCKHTLKGEFCKIAGKCVATDGSNEYDKCQVCDPSLQDNAWSKKPGCCTQNSDCPNGSGCDLGTCDIDTATCKVVKKLGCCLTDAECDDGNLCTADSCDVVSGICTSKPKECPAPSACQKGTCSAKTGVCQGEITPGHCLIDSVCYNEADAQAKNGCKVCNPLLVKEDWSINVGAFCNDNNDCTAGDACNVAAACKGSPIPGCCKNDGDCPVAMEPCQTSKCNLALGLCAKIAKPNCCTVGVCCDVNAGVLKAAGTACADNVLSTEFKCNGATIQKRETVPGCNGTSNEGCSGNLAFVSVGGWVNVQICPANTQCTDVGGGILPSCKPIGPVGSCAGSCGGQSKNGSCFCDGGCKGAGTCCSDFAPLCGCANGECCNLASNYPKPKGTACGAMAIQTQYQCSGANIQSRTGQASCDGANGCSSQANDILWGPWNTLQTCAVNTVCTSVGSGVLPTCKANAPAGSCVGSCSGKSLNGSCYCDSICTGAGDCCGDFKPVCGCASGDCCDINPGIIKAKGTLCGSASFKTQWQCSAANVQKKTGQQICNGASTCSVNVNDLVWSPWGTTQSCVLPAKCIAAADASAASCVAPPPGSCMGKCGGKSNDLCWCDSFCKAAGDCCADFDAIGCAGVQVCGANAAKTCKGKCGGQGVGLCWCDALCKDVGDCCADKAICNCVP